MEKYIYDESTGLWYELHGNYYLPCVTVPERKPVGVWGRRYRKYLKEYRNITYTAMMLAGALDDHLAEIDRHAEEMLYRLIKQMAEQEGITEQLKARDPMEWARQMNDIRNCAVEVVNDGLIYA